MDINTVWNFLSYIPKNVTNFIMKILSTSKVPESVALRVSPLIYWIIVAILVYLIIKVLSKLNFIIKIIIIILIAILIVGFFIPW